MAQGDLNDKKKENKYYSIDEIKKKYQSYRDIKASNITDEEYDDFCDELMALPKEIVDKVYDEIYFVLLSSDPEKGNPACYVNLKEGLVQEKEGIIVLTPHFFGLPYLDKCGNPKKIDRWDQQLLLHEVSHHVLSHCEYEDQKDREEKEKDAEALVRDWLVQFYDSHESE